MLKKISSLSGVKSLSKNEQMNLKGGVTVEMANCVPGSWGCWNPSFCRTYNHGKCGEAFCCNECPSSCQV